MKTQIKPGQLLLLFEFALLSSGAVAAKPIAVTSNHQSAVAVSYADLNLANPAGVKALHRRIEAAAVSVCGDGLNSRLLDVQAAARQCYQSAVKRALQQVRRNQRIAQR